MKLASCGRRRIPLLSLPLLLLLTGCTYHPEGQYVAPVQPPSASTDIISISFNNLDVTSPFPLIFNTSFYYQLEGPNQRISTFSVTVDGTQQIQPSNGGPSAQFYLDARLLSNGTHVVTVTMIVDTQSGSLADNIGAETFTITKSFSVLVDNVPPTPIPTPTLQIENGYLTLRWNAFDKSNFELSVFRLYDVGGTYIDLPDTTLATTATVFVDKGYVGGNVTYGYSIENVSFAVTGYTTFNLDPISPTINLLADHTTQISWAQPTMAGDGQLAVTTRSGVKLFDRTTAGTAAGDTLFLGDQISDVVSIKSAKSTLQDYNKTVVVQSHPNIKPFSQFVSLPVQDKFLIVSKYPNKLYRYSFADYSKEDSTSGYVSTMVASQNGQYGVASLGAFTAFDPLNLTNTSALPSQITSTQEESLFGLSNLNQLSYSYYAPGYANSYATIADANTGQFQYTSAPVPYPSAVNISDDGQYMFFQGSQISVYANSGGTWTPIATIPNNQTWFRNNGTTELISFSATQALVYDLSSPSGGTLSLKRSFNFPASINVASYQFDAAGQLIALNSVDAAGYSTLWIYDPDTFALKGKAKAYLGTGIPNWEHYLYNGHHALLTGYIEKAL